MPSELINPREFAALRSQARVFQEQHLRREERKMTIERNSRACSGVDEKDSQLVWTVNSELLPEAIELALEIHPNPEAIKRSTHVTRLMARNCHQVLGADLITPVEFVV